MDPKGKGMVVNDKEKETIFNELRDDKANEHLNYAEYENNQKKSSS